MGSGAPRGCFSESWSSLSSLLLWEKPTVTPFPSSVSEPQAEAFRGPHVFTEADQQEVRAGGRGRLESGSPSRNEAAGGMSKPRERCVILYDRFYFSSWLFPKRSIPMTELQSFNERLVGKRESSLCSINEKTEPRSE